MPETLKITKDDLCKRFNYGSDSLPDDFISKFGRTNTTYRHPNQKEYEEYILYVLKQIAAPCITRNREKNLKVFEKGWVENLQLILNGQINLQNLKPGYFRESKFFRFDNKLIIPENKDIEYDLFTLSRDIIFNKYLCEYKNIYELGCGSCHNLLMLSQMFPSKNLHGLDWVETSVKIAEELAKRLNKNIEGFVFDMFNPPSDIVIKPDSAIITIHSLEQLGNCYEKLLSFILSSKPCFVLHYEPIRELYDPDCLLDYLALLYCEKRNYLSGYLTALRKLEEQNKIEILEAYRPYVGGVIHESSLIAWRPL